jgi:hypothetical protein
MSFISEFKEFAMKGNVVDMAVGIIIGAAFGKIISVDEPWKVEDRGEKPAIALKGR